MPEGVMSRIWNRFSDGYDAVARPAAAIAKNTVNAGATVLLGEETATTTQAKLVAEALNRGIEAISAGHSKFYTFSVPDLEEDHNIATDEEGMAARLDDLLVELYNDDGSLNTGSQLMVNRELVGNIAGLASDPGSEVSPALIGQAKKVLAQLVTTSARDQGWFTDGCPEEIITILNIGKHEEESHTNKVRKLQATVNLLKGIAAKNPERDLSHATGEFIETLPGHFRGSVGEVIHEFIGNEINDVLSNTRELIDSPELISEPELARDLAETVGQLFDSSVPKAFRSNEMVQASRALLTATERTTRVIDGSETIIGIDEARENFMDLWGQQVDSIITDQDKKHELSQLLQKVETARESALPIVLHRQFTTAEQQAGQTGDYIVVDSSNHENTRLINNRIKALTQSIKDKGEALAKGLEATGQAFEAVASPYNDQEQGIKKLFFARLLEADPNDIDGKDFLTLLTGVDSDDIDFAKLDESDYGAGFTTLKKIHTERLKRKRESLELDKKNIQANINALEAEATQVAADYWVPLERMLSPSETHDIAQVQEQLKSFSTKDELVDATIQALIANHKAKEGILNAFIYQKADGEFAIDEEQLRALALDTGASDDLKESLNRIIANLPKEAEDVQLELLSNGDKDELERIMTHLNSDTVQDRLDSESEELKGILARVEEASKNIRLAQKNLAKVISYERKILKANDTFDAKFHELCIKRDMDSSLAHDPGLKLESLAANITRAEKIDKTLVPLRIKMARLEDQTDPNSARYDDLWETESKSENVSRVFDESTKTLFRTLGLDSTTAQQLTRDIDMFAATYYDAETGTDTPFNALMENLMQKLVQFVTEFIGKR